MTALPRSRRAFLADLGRGAFAVAVFTGVGACAGGGGGGTGPTSAGTTAAGTPTVAGTPSPAPVGGAGPTATAGPTAAAGTATAGAVSWHRVELGFVSAYVLVRDGEAAVVDTGVEGSAPDIEAVLAGAGLGWQDVGHVILTHRHPDHVGSVDAVLEAAAGADTYAGEGDLEAIGVPGITAVGDGDDVFGLRIVTTPGHTPGHVSVLDPAGGLLVAGDALTGGDGGVAGPDPEFTPDMSTAIESARKLAGLSFDTVVFGHGDPVEQDAAARVAALVAEL